MHPNPHLYPPSGWQYVHADGEVFRSGSRDGLIADVADYLEQRGEDQTTAAVLVDAYICRKSPSICSENPPPVPELDAEIARSGRIAAHLAKVGRRVREAARPESVFVPTPLTDVRAAACRNCPFHFQHRVTCGSCNRELVEAANAVAKLSPTPYKRTEDLISCKHYDVFLPPFVRLRNAKPDESAPEGCWRRVS